ncbi:MAG: hypothetical protein WCS37_08020 [Chloroflexota bacterium]|nr:hypothetical protein [Chloroflexota bacterium]
MPANKLSIRRLTLYKHGVGFVEREGQLDESEVQLVFRQSEVNDALKSLLVIDRQGGQVRGIHYETPSASFPDENRITLSEDHSLLDLLRSLRGRVVKLVLGEGTAERNYTGQLLGVEVDPQEPLSKSLVALLGQGETASEVTSLPLKEVRAIYLLEERTEQDLRFFLDSSRNDEAHRTVTLQLDSTQKEHELVVSYLVPCPTWRVSYRLVAESNPIEGAGNETGTKEDRKGELLLQGWGLFDNRLEEDLEEVNVRLVAGQPISFIYDLTSSRIPERPLVADEARVASGPVQFDAALQSFGALQSFDLAGAEFAAPTLAPAPMQMMSAKASAYAPPPLKASLQQQTAGAKGTAQGELFQYEVTTPVTVKRGESALVPILSNNLPYRRELLYNGQKIPQHPVAALRFKNDTGLVLERGPVTIVEDGEYRGEALVPFSPAEAEVYLAYAVELGLKVKEDQVSQTETTGIRIDRYYIYFNQATILKTTYQLENNLGEDRVVTIEQAIKIDYELVQTIQPAEKTAEFQRWKVQCPARKRTTFVIQELTRNWRTEQVLSQTYDNLRRYLEQRWLDSKMLDQLKELLDQQHTINRNTQEINEVANERNELYRRQEQLRQNLSVLATSGEEAQLRRRVFEQLSESETRLNNIDKRVNELKVENKQRQQKLETMLANLGTSST